MSHRLYDLDCATEMINYYKGMSFLVDEKVSHTRTQIIKSVFTLKNALFTWEKYHSIKKEYADLHDTVRRKNKINILEVENTSVPSPVLPKKW